MEPSILDPSSFRVIDPYDPPAPSANGDLGRDDFMRLLITQLQNQDPLSPLEDKDFIAQLSQFSSLEQLMQVNDGLERVEASQGSLVNAQALDLIGRDVLIDSRGQVRLRGGVADEIVYVAPPGTKQATLEIRDPRGQQVRLIELEVEAGGRQRIVWNGKGISTDAEGNTRETDQPDGTYTFTLRAIDAAGQELPSESYLSLRVDGVNFASGGLTLISEDREVPFFNIVEIRTDDERQRPVRSDDERPLPFRY